MQINLHSPSFDGERFLCLIWRVRTSNKPWAQFRLRLCDRVFPGRCFKEGKKRQKKKIVFETKSVVPQELDTVASRAKVCLDEALSFRGRPSLTGQSGVRSQTHQRLIMWCGPPGYLTGNYANCQLAELSKESSCSGMRFRRMSSLVCKKRSFDQGCFDTDSVE